MQASLPMSAPSPARALVMAARLPTLMVGASPVLLAAAFAMTGPRPLAAHAWLVWVATLLAALLMQVGANLVNDVKDAEKGVDTADRLGPVRVSQRGWLSPAQLRRSYHVVFALALLIGAALALYAGPVFLILAMLCSLVAYLYTGGPLPLAYLALGEFMAFLFFGPVAVTGTYFLVAGTWDPAMVMWGAGPGLLAAAVMAINNARDVMTDRLAGKRTLATLLGQRLSVFLPIAAMVGAQLVMWMALQQRDGLAWPAVLSFVMVSVMAALIAWRLLLRCPPRFNPALKATALLCLVYSLAFFVVLR